ncbi:MAG: FAD-dependent thymidylate synthase [Actinobacteria bacterium]|nr:FAD-dependent thymidylate synthase [Actinomycetota bacterium]
MEYPSETFTEAERARLAPHVSDLDGPVFALLNLPETVKGALFARYSRYPGTLKRLFLDEFADSLPELPAGWDTSGEGERAAQLYERVFLGYGDDSVAQLGGAHVACEWVSNVLTKLLQRPRLGAYLEQSTRYIAYDAPMEAGSAPGDGMPRYRYYRDAALGPQYERALDALFDTYAALLPRVSAWTAEQFPRRDGEDERAHARAIKAKALDLLRGLLPAASLSHMGIFASGQTYEQLILHLLAHPLPEAQRYGAMILRAVQATIPSFVTRVERPDRGGAWVEHLRTRAEAGAAWAARLGLDASEGAAGELRPSVALLRHDGSEEDLLAALLFEASGVPEERTHARVAALGADERAALLRDLVGARENRRHRPGRGFEALRYRFEIVSDYGAFRDLQRHRMLTCQWQALTPHLGAEVPEEVELAGCGDDYRRALEVSRAEYERLADAGLREAAPYAVCLGYRIRYVLDMNARAAMQLIELRSGREGHPSYRAVAHALHAAIAEVHPAVAATMTHVDRETEPRLERILSEMRTQARRDAAGA